MLEKGLPDEGSGKKPNKKNVNRHRLRQSATGEMLTPVETTTRREEIVSTCNMITIQ